MPDAGGFLAGAILPDPAPHLAKGASSRRGSMRNWIASGNWPPAASNGWPNYQARLASESGIGSLKVGYNKVFGYYIEVTDSHREKVPADWTPQANGQKRRTLYH